MNGTLLTKTFEDLLSKDLRISGIFKISVRQHDQDDELKDKYFVTEGHRRLFLYKVCFESEILFHGLFGEKSILVGKME